MMMEVVMETRGDAAGMRHAATQMRAKADRAMTVSRRLYSLGASMSYAGPAADRFRSSIAFEETQLHAVAQILIEMADALNRGAASVEVDPVGFYTNEASS